MLRSGTLTAAGSVTGAVSSVWVNGQASALYSDGTYATTAGLSLNDGTNLFTTLATNGSGARVIAQLTPTRLPVSVNLKYDWNGNLTNDG